jgi:DNA-binding winged helix-turn-helix (wHTH) protein/Flp pilus assembly protein TadD
MKEPARPVYEFGPFRLEPTEQRLFCQGQIVPLTPKALDLLTVFVEQSGHLMDKEKLLKAVWEESFVEEANLAYTVSALRKALGDTTEPHRYIETIPKRGYRFVADVRSSRDDGAVGAPTRRRAGLRQIGLGLAAAAVLLGTAVISISLMPNRESQSVQSTIAPDRTRPLTSANREANDYFARAMLFLTVHHDLTRCRESLERALALDPAFSEARAIYAFSHVLMIIGGSSNDSSWFFRAEEEAQRVVADDPTSAQGHVTLGSVYMLTGRKDLASTELKRALELQPRSTEALIWLGNLRLMNGEFAAAREAYTGILAENPLIWPARGLLGLALSFEGRFEAAAREVDKVLKQDPHNVEALSHLATFAWQQGDLGGSRAAVDRALKTQPANYRTRLLHGVQLALDGQRHRALREVDAAVDRYARVNIFVTLEMAHFYAALNDVEKTLEWLEYAGRSGLDHDEIIRRDRLFGPLRLDSRFKQIVDSMASRRRTREERSSTR